jgi:hypothetical protein
MYYQTAHAKRIFGGYISREYPHPFVESTPGYLDLTDLEGEGDMLAVSREQQLSALARYDTRYVVLQKVRLPDVIEPITDVSAWLIPISRVLGERAPIYEDEQLAVYQVPPPGRPVPFVSIGSGWEPRERGPNGTFRWMGDAATLRISSPAPNDARLSFRATTIGEPRQMVLRHGENIVFDETVGALREYEVELQLPEGESELHVLSPLGTVSPAQLGLGGDARRLGFAFLEIELEVVQE